MSPMNPWDALTYLAAQAGATVTLRSDGEEETMAVECDTPEVVDAFLALAQLLGGKEV